MSQNYYKHLQPTGSGGAYIYWIRWLNNNLPCVTVYFIKSCLNSSWWIQPIDGVSASVHCGKSGKNSSFSTSSTATTTVCLLDLIHRHGSHTWSLERTESMTSDCQSGIMLSSVGASRCNSPACVEARAQREAASCLEDQRRPMTQYRDSVDSLRDSPHSERSGLVVLFTTCYYHSSLSMWKSFAELKWERSFHK